MSGRSSMRSVAPAVRRPGAAMLAALRRRPRTAGEFTADGLRIVGVVSVAVAAIRFDATDAGVLAFALPALLAPRLVEVRAWFDLLVCGSILVAAWSNVFDVYSSVAWWDLAVHFTCTGALAALMFLLFARLGFVPAPAARGFSRTAGVLLTTAIGLALSAVWEMVEWLGHTFVSDEIFVAYTDTIGDMAIGGLGALGAGFLLASAVRNGGWQAAAVDWQESAGRCPPPSRD